MCLVVKYASRTEVVAAGAGVVVRILDGHETTIADVDRLARIFEAELADAPRVGYLQVIHQGTPPLAAEVRRHGATLLERHAERTRTVIVLLGLGFWISSLRLALRVFAGMLSKGGVEVVASVEAGVEALAGDFVTVHSEVLLDAYMALAQDMRQL